MIVPKFKKARGDLLYPTLVAGGNFCMMDIVQALSEHADCNEMAKDLIQDLGFVSLLQGLATTDYERCHPGAISSKTSSLHDMIQCQPLSLEGGS